MLFESRKILIGFRIKLNFDASLEKENSYVFVNLSETPTIQDLLNTIKRRFEISRDVYIALNDCRLLNSEDNSVLIDVPEVKIVPCKFKTSVVSPSKISFKNGVPSRDSFKIVNAAQTAEINDVSDNIEAIPTRVEELASDEKINENVSCTKEITNRKSKRFYSSIAETIKYLNQHYKPELENENLFLSSNNVTTLEIEDCEKEKEMKAAKEECRIKNEEECYLDDVSFQQTSDECVEKKKRKRKRKHSKKTIPECDRGEAINGIHDLYVNSSMETNTDCLQTKPTRQHIFFNVENDDSIQDDQHSAECNLVIDSSSPIRSYGKKARWLENVVESTGNHAINTNGIADVTDGGNDKFEEKSVIFDSETRSTADPLFSNERENSCPKRLVSGGTDSLLATNAKYRTTFEKSTDSPSKLSLNDSFFSSFNAIVNRCSFQTKEFPPKNAHPLSTLLMCKQLQTPVEYNVQFAPSRSRSNSCVSVTSKKSASNSSIIYPNSTVLTDNGDKNSNDDDDDECEVLSQYKIVGDKVLLRDSNGTWDILSEKDASLKLQPVEEPLENQSITFQLLYLGPDMCPSMSDLICGKVISFQKDSGRLIVNILPAFIEALLKNFKEDACLPDELVHITENTYQISWIAVKNPRLLM